MVAVIADLQAATVAANLERVRAEIARAGREGSVEILAAVKYLPLEALGQLREAGLTLLGENRAQDLVAKASAYPGAFTWDFIGALQSRKVAQIVPHVRYIQSVASDSALVQLARHATPQTRIMFEVNVAGEAGKSGIMPAELAGYLERAPVPVVGLMTMPPMVADGELNRRHFAALRELAERHGLRELSMGTTQDYVVAVQEGATIIRLGRSLYFPGGSSSTSGPRTS